MGKSMKEYGKMISFMRESSNIPTEMYTMVSSNTSKEMVMAHIPTPINPPTKVTGVTI